MAQRTRYSPSEEQELMSKLWSAKYADDPLMFVLLVFPWGVENTPLHKHKGPRRWQRRVLQRLRDHIASNKGRLDPVVLRKAIASGRGIGKSALVAWLIIWMLTTRIGSSVIVSANTEHQLRAVTWGELAKWVAMSINSHWWDLSSTKLSPASWLSELVERDLKKGTRYWAAEGKLWSEENPDGYAGVHNHDGTMVIFDEGSGIPDSIWPVASGYFTEPTNDRYWFAFSNPRRRKGYFFECFNSKRDFWDSENIDSRTVEGTDQQVYADIIGEYGANSRQARVEVYGQFPESDIEQFISTVDVAAAMARKPYNDRSAPVVMGVDPARGGDDSTVVVVRQGRDILTIRRFKIPDTMRVVGEVLSLIEQYNPVLTMIDEGGLGAGVFDRLRERGVRVLGVQFGEQAENPAAWKNKRAEIWGAMRDWIKTAALPNDKLLAADLTGPTAEPDSNGIIALETKKKMKSRGLASPDSADAIAVTFAYRVFSSAPFKQRQYSVA